MVAHQRDDYAKAMNFFRPLAKARYSLGLILDNSLGLPHDNAEAVKLYCKAAEQSHADAQNCLGFLYASGEGVPQDHAEAVKLFRLAAEQGDADAQSSLGVMYANGDGVRGPL
ncbi:MAG: sel1 repeat family protein [Gammaproteobacteria bacterium]|nr:sel1 repeat family protein [Gammaproteobacteria bacterium]